MFVEYILTKHRQMRKKIETKNKNYYFDLILKS